VLVPPSTRAEHNSDRQHLVHREPRRDNRRLSLRVHDHVPLGPYVPYIVWTTIL
jgi:hypothetical protein